MTSRRDGNGPINDNQSALRPLSRSPLYATIAERLLSYIVQSELHPGDRLPAERELAQRLGVSRNSVRQASVALQIQGVLEVRHGDGTFLRHLDRRSAPVAAVVSRQRRLPEELEARRIVEVPIAALSAQRATAADLKAIDAGLALMRRELEKGKIGLDGDKAFHAAVTKSTHNGFLIDLMDRLADAISETRAESLSQPGRPVQSLEDHERIAEAIRAGDAEAAAAAMQAHIGHVSDVRLLTWDLGATKASAKTRR